MQSYHEKRKKMEARIRRVQILFGDIWGFLLINIIIKDKIYIVVGRIFEILETLRTDDSKKIKKRGMQS